MTLKFASRVAFRARSIGTFCVLSLLAAAALAQPAPRVLTPPSLVGAYPVGCSNVEQDISRLKTGETLVDYWEGNPGATGRYVTDLLVAPTNALTYNITVPPRSQIDVFERNGGKQLQYAAIACYPTTAANTRANYTLPVGRVPKMQRGTELPIIANNPRTADGKWPLIVLSHGLAGSPLGNEYLQVIERFAAEGYIVFAPFHADARFSRTKINNLSDAVYVVAQYDEIAEMQALRPIGLKQGLDYFLTRSEFANTIDQDQIVGFGASLGGMAMMLAQGAKMTTSLGGAERTILRDNRYKAIVGYVPFSGYSFQPAFGDSNQGVKGIRVPYLGIGGTADVVAPISRTSQAIEALGGSKYFVTIEGMPHGLRAEDAPELFGWTFAFYDAHLSRNQADRNQFDLVSNFLGNADDRVKLKKTLAWGSRDELEVVNFISKQGGKMFMTGFPQEIALLDSLPDLWQRTGHRFATFRNDTTLGQPMCRFWGFDNARINTHFYSLFPEECALVRAQSWARDEGNAMRAQNVIEVQFDPRPPAGQPQSAKTCPADMVRVHRLFNINTLNHMYITEGLLTRSVFTAEWSLEGPVFCAAKYED
ncbi:MAG: alpha/beta hydrolase family protein [Casimicrobium sp.]